MSITLRSGEFFLRSFQVLVKPPLVVSAAMVAAILATGCGESESIEQYDVDRTSPRPPRLEPAEVAASLDHMYAAIVRGGDTAWFFKAVAPGKNAEDLAEPFKEFLSTVSVEPGAEKPSWKLPEGWQEKAGGPMRAATIEIPYGDSTVELAVSSLPLQGSWERFLEANVNRWLNQFQQAPLSEKAIVGLARTTPTEGGEATLFELVGVMERPSSMPPGHPPVSGSTPPMGDQAAAAPASGSEGAAGAGEAKQPEELRYDVPADWRLGPPSSMRKATLLAGGDDGAAELAITAFPPAPMMVDPVANAKRWAGQIGIPAPSDEQMKSAITTIKIDDGDGQYFELWSPSDAPDQKGILAAMVEHGGEVWFFKFSGDRPVLERQRDAFRKFLNSVKFTSGG